MLQEEGDKLLTVFALPGQHRKRMRSTNMLERWFEEVRREDAGGEDISEPASCVRLTGAHCMGVNEEWLGRRYLGMEPERIEEAAAGWTGPGAIQRAARSGPLRSQHPKPWRCKVTQHPGLD